MTGKPIRASQVTPGSIDDDVIAKQDHRTSDEKIVERIIDYARNHPQGFTWRKVCDDLNICSARWQKWVSMVRRVLADTPENLVCERKGPGLHPYRLVGTLDEATPWLDRERATATTMLGTVQAVMLSIKNATDKRSVEGRQVRKDLRRLTYLLTEMTEPDD